MPLLAGALDRRIVIQRNTAAQDTAGEPVESWATLSTVWAQIEPLRGVERWQAEQVNAELELKVRIRYLAGVTPKDRFTLGGETYEIESVMEIGRQEGMELLCSAKVDD